VLGDWPCACQPVAGSTTTGAGLTFVVSGLSKCAAGYAAKIGSKFQAAADRANAWREHVDKSLGLPLAVVHGPGTARVAVACNKSRATGSHNSGAMAVDSLPELFAYYVHIWKYRYMDSERAILAFSALAQPTRLEAFRMLVRAGPKGLPAGELARKLGVPQNTLSAHLGILARSGLVRSERQSRQIFYCPQLDQVRALTVFLLKSCCGGRPELCEPLISDLASPRRKKAAAHG
jgi:ArsR family transcriptional regulator, arsenate/arsenite/antimonite-responsive transcriptional repressor